MVDRAAVEWGDSLYMPLFDQCIYRLYPTQLWLSPSCLQMRCLCPSALHTTFLGRPVRQPDMAMEEAARRPPNTQPRMKFMS